MISSAKRRVIATGLFFVLVFAGDRIGGGILSRVFHSTQFRFSQLYSGDLPADVVFIGNSRGVHMFHRPPLADLSGQRVANVSFNGMPAELMPAIFTDYLQHHAPPKQLFIEVSCVGRRNEAGSLERFKILSPVSASIGALLAEQRPTVAWAGRVSLLFQFNSELFWRSLFFRNESDQDWIMDSRLSDNPEVALSSMPVRVFERSPTDAMAIRRLMQIARDAGTQPKLILAPYAPGYRDEMVGLQAWQDRLASELDAPILDYINAINDLDSFADPIHLNARGARQLAETMIERGDLNRAL